MINKLSLNKRLILLIPYFLIALIFIITPFILIFIKSFTPVSKNIDNWNIVKTQNTLNIVFRSILVGLLTSFISMFLGIPYAYFVSRTKNKIIKSLLISLIISPLFIFTIARAFALRGTLMWMFDKSGNDLNNNFVLILGSVYLYMPLFIMPVYSVFVNMPNSIIESSNDLGYSNFKTFFKVILPYGLKGIISGFTLVFMISSTSIVVSEKILPNGRNFKLLGNLINDYSNPVSKFDIASASTIAILSIGIISLVFILIHSIPFIFNKMKGNKNV